MCLGRPSTTAGNPTCVGWLWDFICLFPVYLTSFPTTFADLAQGWKEVEIIERLSGIICKFFPCHGEGWPQSLCSEVVSDIQSCVFHYVRDSCRYVHIFFDPVAESSCSMNFLSFICLHFPVMLFHFCSNICNICKIFADPFVVKLISMEYCPFKSIVAAVETLDIFVPAWCNDYGVLYLLMLIYFDSLRMIIHLQLDQDLREKKRKLFVVDETFTLFSVQENYIWRIGTFKGSDCRIAGASYVIYW